MTVSIEGVASGMSDLTNMMSHKEVGIIDDHVASPIKEDYVRLAIDCRRIASSSFSFPLVLPLVVALRLHS